MSTENDKKSEMRPEYDIRGGVRGKYFARYSQPVPVTITFESTPLMTQSSASAEPIGAFTKTAVYPLPYPSPKVHVAIIAA